MKRGLKLIFVGVASIASISLFARGAEGNNKGNNNNRRANVGLAANCVPATDIIRLDFNNVSTRVESGGLWWQDRANGLADYEVPKNSNSFAIYAGGLWMAGTDVNGQLKAAVSKFGQGVDYWTGPLRVDGSAEIDPETCQFFDKFYEISRQEVQEFILFKENEGDAEALTELGLDGYSVPDVITEWPGNSPQFIDGQEVEDLPFILAPFVDLNGNEIYEPNLGDYPFYDISGAPKGPARDSLVGADGSIDCRAPRASRSESSQRPLFGDKTFWWMFNDKGNLHTESNAPSIGMEIHGQAFAFATNDEVNDMTFYNFELINRSTFTLTDTYFASYVDPDLGNSADDYVGCDVGRGLGYCYNGDDFDESVRGQTGYGSTPAVIGIDFFEGPYQDADGIDNLEGILDGQALNGLGYGDSLIDNERFGMRRFVYYNIGSGQNGDPQLAIHYYNYMRGIWQNGSNMLHGGDGLANAGVEDGIPTAFMFPGDSDPLHWGTTFDNITQIPANNAWTEDNPGGGLEANPPGDRRFVQSAGPFTLEPGNVNDITVGVVFAQAESGGRLESVEKIFSADDKAQALFDNCFKVLDGPDAPQLTIQELDGELILYLDNGGFSNNVNEEYAEEDPNIITPENVRQALGREYDKEYRFQGYQIFQVSDKDVSVSELYNPAVSRLLFQVDIADNIDRIVNYTFDEALGSNVAQIMVDGNNEGIAHSFRVTEDLFAVGERNLINFKTYYYIAIAYGYNNYKTYQQDASPDPNNVLAPAYDGQKLPYISSRRGPTGGAIESVSAIPHNNKPQEGGTVVNAQYGDLVGITRWQGTGNGNNPMVLTDATIDRLMDDKDWLTGNKPTKLEYKLGEGPLSIKVVDPLSVVDGDFVLKFVEEGVNGVFAVTDTAEWLAYRVGKADDEWNLSERTISTRNEQIIPEWGLSIEIGQSLEPASLRADGSTLLANNGLLGSSITFDDPTKPWLSGVPDQDVQGTRDWILAGSASGEQGLFGDRTDGTNSPQFIDPDGDYESILDGTIAPYGLVSYGSIFNGRQLFNRPGVDLTSTRQSKMEYLNSVALFFTKDTSKWTRCPVVELQEEPAKALTGDIKFRVRTMPSVDREGRPWRSGSATNVNDPNNAAYIDSIGFGWFPGYAIDQETGERLNILFGEDSWYGTENGADMIWNPTSVVNTGQGTTNPVWGGKHYIYVFRKSQETEDHIRVFPANLRDRFMVPAYDGGKKLAELIRSTLRVYAWSAATWVAIPLLTPGQELLATDVRVDLEVANPYDTLTADLTGMVDIAGLSEDSLNNNGLPSYTFKTQGFAVEKGVTNVVNEQLAEINVVPNPYYAISEYEESALDNLVKITNLPENCSIKIYNMSGTLIRAYQKADPLNFLDWDLKNQVGIPISSGVYIIHIEVPNVGETVIKWFGVMRPVDLNNF